MRNFLLITVLLPVYLFAQVFEDFSDGDFTQDPAWFGDLDHFKLSTSTAVPESQRPAIQLDAPEAGISSISVSGQFSGDLVWHFWIRLSMNTSPGNFSRVYLISDTSNLHAPLEGYFIQVGGVEDSVVFFRQDSLYEIKLLCLDSLFTGNSTNTMRFKVVRSKEGNWKFHADPAGGQSLDFRGEVNDLTFPGGEYFGIYCQYTSSNTTKFYFDDLYAGPPVIDSLPPELSNAGVVSPSEILLTFSEAIGQETAEILTNYEVSPDIGNPYEAIRLSDPSKVDLFFDHELQSGVNYTLNIAGIEDLSGNNTGLISYPLWYYQVNPFDIIVNEVLFNPMADGVDYVELYNRGGKAVNLEDLILASVKESQTGLPDTQSVSIAASFKDLLPGQYLVLTPDAQIVQIQYSTSDPGSFLELASFPSYNNDKGFVLLTNREGQVIDGFHYSEDFHFLMLNSTEGVSLERICPDRLGDDPANWHSAAETVGFGTPGYENSQFLEASDDGTSFSVQPEVFSPDSDGQDDQLGINYNFSSPGKLISVIVFNAEGRVVKMLANNEMPGTHGIYSWDGTLDDRTAAQNGIYIIYMEALGMDGKTRHYKKAAVLARSR